MQIYSGPYEVEHQSGEVRRLEVTGLGIFDRDKQLVARFRKLQPHLGARKLLRYLSLPCVEKRAFNLMAMSKILMGIWISATP